MAQLRGSEQGELTKILSENLTEAQLERALLHNDLPKLENLAEGGTLKDKATDVVKRLSRRYRVIELAEAVLAEFDDELPPLAAWLNENRDLLEKRKGGIGAIIQGKTPWLTRILESVSLRVVAGLAVLGLAALLGPKLCSERPEPASLTVHAEELIYREGEEAPRRRPFAGAELTIEAANFEMDTVQSGTTDARGRASIRIWPKHAVKNRELKAYIHVAKVPKEREGDMPLMPDHYGVWYKDGTRVTAQEALNLAKNAEVQIYLFPLSAAPKFFGPMLSQELRRTLANASFAGHQDPASYLAAVNHAAKTLDLGQVLTQSVVKSWITDLARSRPVLPAGGAGTWNGHDLGPTVSRAAPSVCYVRGRSAAGTPYRSTGFVVARELVLTNLIAGSRATAVGFGDQVGEADDRELRVAETLFENTDYAVSLLHVPGLTARPLTITSEKLVATAVGSPVVVLGYPELDARLPDEIGTLLDLSGAAGRRSAMPGELLWLDEKKSGDAPVVPERELLGHDATTMSGVGGGPVIDLETGQVLALHFGGTWKGDRKENYASPIWRLLADQRFSGLLRSRGARIGHDTKREPPREPVLDVVAGGFDESFVRQVRVPLPRIRDRARIGPRLGNRVLAYRHFSLVVDESRGYAAFVAANVDRERLQRVPRRENDTWALDPRVSAKLQRGNELYARNDWDRGHLIRPSIVAWGSTASATEAYRAANTYTNATPQHKNFNRGAWMHVEEHVLRGLHPDAERYSVFAGPVTRRDDFEYRGTRIPRSYWMVVVVENADTTKPPLAYAYLLDQYALNRAGKMTPLPLDRSRDVKRYQVRVTDVEKATGLDFGPVRKWDRGN